MANYNVVKNPKGGWDAKRDKATRASSNSNTQKEAERCKDFQLIQVAVK